MNFLSDQLELCEKSPFCQVTVVGDVLAGFKHFVVNFMIRMSKVCATECSNTQDTHETFLFPIGLCYIITERRVHEGE